MKQSKNCHLRDEYAEQFNYDLDLKFEDLQKKLKESGRKYILFSDKKDKTEETDDIKKPLEEEYSQSNPK